MAKKFIISANSVTLARIALLPVPVALLQFKGDAYWWVAFVFFVFLGATDFIDGLMARAEGPTKLGSLLDPVADKIFVGALALTLISYHYIPEWMVAILFSREFLIIALRSITALRGEPINTSVLAKIKTIIQMGGFGTIFLAVFLPNPYLYIPYIGLSVGFLLVWIVFMIKRGQAPYWAAPVSFVGFCLLALNMFTSLKTLLMFQYIAILFVTWGSGISYVAGSYRAIAKTGLSKSDAARIFWALSHSVFVAPLVGIYPILILPILIAMSLEFATGGIDNVVANDANHMGVGPGLITGSAATIFALTAYGTYFGVWDLNPLIGSIFYAAVSLITFIVLFKKWGYLFKGAL